MPPERYETVPLPQAAMKVEQQLSRNCMSKGRVKATPKANMRAISGNFIMAQPRGSKVPRDQTRHDAYETDSEK